MAPMNADELILTLQDLPEHLRKLPVTFVGADSLYSVEVTDVVVRERLH